MSLGKDWKKRVDAAKATSEEARQEEREAAIARRAREIIASLPSKLASAADHRCLVMHLHEGESSVHFDQLRDKQYTSSEPFLGAAKTVVEHCLRNDLDVYVWEEDFSMSRGQVGAEIWVTPKGIPYHLPKT